MKRRSSQPTSAVIDFSQPTPFDGPADEAESGCVWSLVRRSETGEDEHRTDFSTGCLTVGRRPDNRLCICQRTVSGHHAELTVRGDDLALTDLGSTNGTLVNGRRVTGTVPLHNGDVVHFGQVVFSIEQSVQQHLSPDSLANKTFVAAAPEDAVLYEGFDRLLNCPDIVLIFSRSFVWAAVTSQGMRCWFAVM